MPRTGRATSVIFPAPAGAERLVARSNKNSRPDGALPFPYQMRALPEVKSLVNLMTEQEVSKRLNVSVASLRRWRLTKRGPAFLKVGSLVRYQPEDLEAWLASLPTGGTARHEQLPSGQAIRLGDSRK